jgi:DNA-binding transcriptional ArsR family regulator
MSARDYIERVRSLRCVVCTIMGTPQEGPTFSHHVESVRDGLSDYATVALCHYHHQGAGGVHKLSRSGFLMRYKLTDVDLIALTVRALDREGALHV